MKKKIALLLCAAMVLALTACGKEKTPEPTPTPKPVTVTATPTPGQKKTVTATPTATPTTKVWEILPTWTPKPTPTLTPEQQAAKEAEEAAKLAASQFGKTFVLDFSRTVAASGDLPAISDNGIAATGEKTQKFIIPLDVIVTKNKSALVTVTMQFNNAGDEQIRVYGIQGTADSAKSTIGYIKNPGTTDTVTLSAVITANDDFNALLVASSGWGVNIKDVLIKKITIAPNPAVDFSGLTGISGDAPTVDANGAIVAKGGVTQKFAFPLGNTYKAGDVLAVTVTGKFNSKDDEQIRLYAIQGTNDAAKTDIGYIKNTNTGKAFTETVFLTVNKDSEADYLLVASGGWGQVMNDIVINSISVKKAAVIDNKSVIGINGAAPTVNDDGVILVKDQANKFAFPVSDVDLSKNSKVTVAVTAKFKSADDASFRFYTIKDGADSACCTPVYVNNPGTTDEKTIVVELNTYNDGNQLLVAGSSYGVTMNDIEIKKIVVYESPLVAAPVSDTTPKTGDNSMMIMIVLFGMAAVSGVIFFKKREEV